MVQRIDSNPAGASNVRYNDDLDKMFISAPTDRIRWASVLGGLFTALSATIVMTVLGIAIGLSTFDANNPQTFGIGAGVYGAFTAIIAFFLGGFLSARTASVAGAGNGLLNGAMVWLVALPLIVNVLTAGIGTLLGFATNTVGTVANTAISVAGTAADVAAPIIAENADQIATAAQQAFSTAAPTLEAGATQVAGALADGTAEATAEAPVEAVVNQAQEVVATVQAQVENIDAEDINQATRDASSAAWATLLALGLSAGAALLGGVLGARSRPTDVAVLNR